MKVYVVLPMYNEAATLSQLLTGIQAVFKGQDVGCLVVAIDDGSRDETPAILAEWSLAMPIHVIRHTINRGLGETVRDGFEWIADNAHTDDIIVRMDGDNTHDPKYIADLVAKILAGFDVAIASRFCKGGGMLGVNWYRTLMSLCANWFMKLLFPISGVRDYSCGFRAYRATLIKRAVHLFGNLFIDLKGLGFTCTVEKLIKCRMLKAKMAEVPFVLRYDQKEGSSKMITSITTLGYLILALKNIYPWGRHNKILREQSRHLQASEGLR